MMKIAIDAIDNLGKCTHLRTFETIKYFNIKIMEHIDDK